MKKGLIIIILFFLTFNVCNAEELEREVVTFVACDSASTYWVKSENKTKRIQLIAYDKTEGSLDNQIDEFACDLVQNASVLEIAYDSNASKTDKYNRHLVWLYVDNELLQEKLIKKGYGQVNYITGEYTYLTSLCEAQKQAIILVEGIWNYEGIEETYCSSGVKIGEKQENNESESQEEDNSNINIKILYLLIFINSGVLILLILLKVGRKNG